MNFNIFMLLKSIPLVCRNKNFLILIMFILGLSFFVTCEDGEEIRKKETKTIDLFLLTISYLRSQGNCKVIEKSDPSDTVSCNRKPNGLCTSNEKIITSGELTKTIKEARDFIDLYPNCFESLGQSGLLSTKVTTESEKEEILTNYIYETVSSCEEIGLVLLPSESLANLEEILFLESPKGKIGRAAQVLKNFPLSPLSTKDKANFCLSEGFSESERTLLQNFQIGNIILSKNL